MLSLGREFEFGLKSSGRGAHHLAAQWKMIHREVIIEERDVRV